MRYWLLCLMVVLVACGDKTKEQEQSPPATESSLSAVATDVPPTRVVRRTPTAVPTAIPTATIVPEIQQVAGDKSLALSFTVTQGGPDPLVDSWNYSGLATVRVQLDGTASGSGVLWPIGVDPECRVTSPSPSTIYAFDVQGYTTYDGARVRLHLLLVPQDIESPEQFQVRCPDEPLEGHFIETNFLWPMLTQVEALDYILYLDEIVSIESYTEDLAARTDGALTGTLAIEAQLQQ